tara:strand:+ start:689 stop:1495 length:807 start_codon:yes stop_codon:yes gene_type:complete
MYLKKKINDLMDLFKISHLKKPLKRLIFSKIELDPDSGSDDYNWDLYHRDYEKQIKGMSVNSTLKLKEGDFYFKEDKLILKEGLLPLHKNHTALYEVVGKLKPKSIIEIGCGGGDHLHNIGVLYPFIKKRGFDRSISQLSFLEKRSPELSQYVETLDITLPPSNKTPTADIVYSQAVIMHIQSSNSHLVALANMFRMALKSVVLMENFNRHNFVDDINMLHKKGMIDWQNINFYIHKIENKPHILIISKEEIEMEKLNRYQDLLIAMD